MEKEITVAALLNIAFVCLEKLPLVSVYKVRLRHLLILPRPKLLQLFFRHLQLLPLLLSLVALVQDASKTNHNSNTTHNHSSLENVILDHIIILFSIVLITTVMINLRLRVLFIFLPNSNLRNFSTQVIHVIVLIHQDASQNPVLIWGFRLKGEER